ncbi:uncharacterized protein BYT42DRAFT_517249 [Radiomyces spectabilis]|uniref:uncharacterized protein n=1 Tax=Radiomyces spectabilis TaxID=64574 RepID=UPI00221FB620|nr:uncharacterized protein BYT42DRAFT_517249 [Radiomyces spectabilis]KAI8376350.1 hypothetical protein BYT42DRAFT_517249 [Radiomyces spectabilis]
MKFVSTCFIAAALFAVTSAQKPIVSVTSPLSGTKYKAGSEAIISWINPAVPNIPQIVLARGPSSALQPVMTIAQNVNAADGKYVWKIPLEIENGDEYAFEIGQSPDLAFAGPFTIEGGVGGTLPASSNGGSSSTSNNGMPVGGSPANANSNSAATPAAPASSARANQAAARPSGSNSASSVATRSFAYVQMMTVAGVAVVAAAHIL